MSEPFIGEVSIFAGSFAPRAWAFCAGQLLPISSNTALFSLLGTTYGGDGRTTFALPNLMNRAPMGPGNGPGLTSRRLGEKVGTPTVTLNTSQIPSHHHEMLVKAAPGDSSDPTNRHLAADDSGDRQYLETSNGAQMAEQAIRPAGGSLSHDNEQPYLALSYIIALFGVYPSRG